MSSVLLYLLMKLLVAGLTPWHLSQKCYDTYGVAMSSIDLPFESKVELQPHPKLKAILVLG